MKLRSIEVRRLPGIDRPFVVGDLSGELNLISGPNGSGKSSLCRAIRAILWPKSGIPRPADVATSWSDGDALFHAEMGTAVTWQKDGVPSPSPTLPPQHMAHCYTLGLADLFDVDGRTEKDVAALIRKQMQGGYDLDAPLEKRKRNNRFGKREMDALATARREADRIAGARNHLAGEERRLADLETAYEKAEAASREITLIETGIELAQARGGMVELERSLAEYPPGLDRIDEELPDRIREHENELRRAKERLEEEREILREADDLQERTPLKGGAVDEVEIESHALRLKKSESAMRTAASWEEKVEAARATLDRCAALLAGSIPVERLEGEAGELIDRADRWIEKVSYLREKRTSLEAALEIPGSDDREEDTESGAHADARDEAIRSLLDWIESPEPSGTTGNSSSATRIPALLFLAAGIAGAFLLTPWLIVLAGVGAGLLAASFFRPQGREGEERRRAARERFDRTGIESPARWSEETIRERLASLFRETGKAEAAGERRLVREEERKKLAARLSTLEKEEAEAAGERGDILAAAGGEGNQGWSDLRIHFVAGLVASWRDAATKAADATSHAETAHAARDAEFGAVRDFAGRHLGEAPADEAGCAAAIEKIRKESAALAAAADRRTRAETEIPRLEGRVTEQNRGIDLLYERAAVDPGDREEAAFGLRKKLALLEDYRETAKEARLAEARIADLKKRLNERPGYIGAEAVDLEILLEKQRITAAGVKDLAGEIGRIRGEVKAATASADLEEATARVAVAKEALLEKGNDALLAAAGRFLLDRVRKGYDRESRPEVLNQASTRFSEFTDEKYELAFRSSGEAGGELRAVESGSGRGLALGELSDATRAQLLLATRLSYAVTQETERKPPLFLDEALSTSDPERFRAVAESVVALCRKGRQVFYLTSDPADCKAWGDLAAGAGIEVREIDLAAVRNLARGTLLPGALTVRPAVEPPEPAGLSEEEYAGLLGVPAPDRFAPLGETHIFFLARERLDLLHKLLRARIETVGQWEVIKRRGAAHSIVSSEEEAFLEGRRAIAGSFTDAWRTGRNRPLSRAELTESGVLSDKWIGAGGDILEECHGDGGRLLDVLRAKNDARMKGFQQRTADKLEEWLEESGFIDQTPPLDDGAIRASVLARVGALSRENPLSPDEVNRVVDRWLQLFGSEQLSA